MRLIQILQRAILAVLALTVSAAFNAANAQRLFRSTDPVEITFTTSLKALIKERDSTKLSPHPALMTYKDSGGNGRAPSGRPEC